MARIALDDRTGIPVDQAKCQHDRLQIAHYQ
jgi:hypothetical protein